MLRILLLILTVTTLMACSTTSKGDVPTESFSKSPTAQSNSAPNTENIFASTPVPSLEIQPGFGIDVGDTVPHFEFTLSDGSRQSTTQLARQGKPAFLYFFTTD